MSHALRHPLPAEGIPGRRPAAPTPASRWRGLAGVLSLLLTACALFAPRLADAGDLSRDDLARRFQPPLHVGDKLRDIPAWPISSELEPEAGPVAYAFESIDLAPIPGFEGTPYNLLVSIDRQGNFLGVELPRQHEPVFLSGLGEGPLRDFLRQYEGKSLKQEITVSSLYGNTRSGAGAQRRPWPRNAKGSMPR